MDSSTALSKMISLIEKIQDYTKDLDYDQFMQNDITVEACAFNLSQLGELSHKLLQPCWTIAAGLK